MSKQKKILALLTTTYARGGISKYNQNILNALASHQHVFQVIAFSRDRINKHINFPKHILLKTVPNKVHYILRVFFTVFKYKSPDMIFCGHIHLLPLALIINYFTKAPIWLQIHGIEVWKRPNKFKRWLITHINYVISNSRYTRDQFCLNYHFNFHQIKLLPCMVEDHYSPAPKSLSKMQQYDLSNKKILLTVSRLDAREQYKGIDKVIAILPTLLRTFPNICYLIVGEGDDKIRLKYLAQRLSVEQQVRFLDDISDDALPQIYHLADLYVMPSLGEGFGIVFLEALLSGLTVVAGKFDGSVDALQEGKLGYLVNPNNATELSNIIITALQNEYKSPIENVNIFKQENFVKHSHLLLDKLFFSLRSSS